MFIAYLLLPYIESGFKNKDSFKKKSGKDLNEEVDELSGLLKDFKKKSNKNSNKDFSEKSNIEPKSDKELSKKFNKNFSKKNSKKSISNNLKNKEKESKDKILIKYIKAT
jgi:hypothetical protein